MTDGTLTTLTVVTPAYDEADLLRDKIESDLDDPRGMFSVASLRKYLD